MHTNHHHRRHHNPPAATAARLDSPAPAPATGTTGVPPALSPSALQSFSPFPAVLLRPLSSALLCLLTSVLCLAPLSAQNLLIFTDTTVTGAHYENVGTGTAALTNTGTWTFTGTNITLSGTAATGNGNGRIAANFTGGGKLDLTDSDIKATFYGIQLTNTSAATLDNTTIATTAADGHGVNLYTSSTLNMTGGAITTAATSARGISASGASHVTLQDTAIRSYNTGIYLSGTSVLAPYHADITTQNGHGLHLTTSSTATLTGGTIATTAINTHGIYATDASRVTLQDTAIRSYDRGIVISGTSVLDAWRADITTQNGHGLDLHISSTATLIGGTITTTLGGAGVSAGNASRVSLQGTVIRSYGLGITLSNTAVLDACHVDIITQAAHGLILATSSTATITGGTIATTLGGAGVSAAGASTVDLQDTVIRSYGQGVSLGASAATLNNTTISTTAANAHGISLTTASMLTMTGGSITTGTARGIHAVDASHVTLEGAVVIRSYADGIYLSNTSVLAPYHADITTQNGHGLSLNTSSTATITGGSIATTNAGVGVYAENASTVDLQNLTITTGTANNAYGIHLAGSSTATLHNTSITTSAANAHGLNINASTATFNGVTITTGTTNAYGISASVASRLTLEDTVIRSYSNGITLTGASVLEPSRVDITTQNGYGLRLDTSSTATITGGSIATAGNSQHGIYAIAGSMLDLQNLAITTTGNSSHGIYLNASTGTLHGGAITTGTTSAVGVAAAGASRVTLQDTIIRSYSTGISLSGTSVLAPYHADIITQAGAGLELNASSTATLTGGSITTGSTGNGLGGVGVGVSVATASAVDLHDIAITTLAANSHGISLGGASTLTMHGGSITTGSTNSHGIVAAGASHVTLEDTVIRAYQHGITLSGTSVLDPYHADITTQTGIGLTLDTSSTATLTGGTITTLGGVGVNAGGASRVSLQDTVIRSSGVGISLSNTSVLAPYHADITTQNGHGLTLNTFSTATITGGSITTTLGGNGVNAAGASTIALKNLTITTGTVANSHGITLNTSSTATLVNLTITTVANGAHGLNLAASSTAILAGGTITTGTNTAYGVNVTTASRVTLEDTVIRSYSHGINLSGTSVLEPHHADIITQNGYGLNLNTSSTATITGGSIATGGASQHGILAAAASTLDLQNLAITTAGNGAYGLYLNASTATLTGGAIATTSTNAYGVNAIAASRLTLEDTVIRSYSHGINLSGTSVLEPYHADIITQNGIGLNLATSSTATLTGGAITTAGANQHGVAAATASRVTLQDVVIRSQGQGITLSGASVLAPYHADIITQNGHGINLTTSSTATITGGSITTTNGGNGVNATTASTVHLADGVSIRSHGDGINLTGSSALAAPWHADITTQTGNGLSLNLSSTAAITGGAITLAGTSGANRYGLVVGNYGPNHLLVENTLIDSLGGGLSIGTPTAILNNVTIRAFAEAGINTYYSGAFTMTGGSITYTGGGNAAGVYANERGHGSLIDVAILTTAAAPGLRIQNTSGLDLTRGSVTTTADRAAAVRILARPGNTLTLDHVAVTTTGADAPALWMDANYTGTGGLNTVTITGGTLASARHTAIGVNVQKYNPADPEANAATLLTDGADVVYDITITGAATIHGGARLLDAGSIYTGTDATGALVEVVNKNTILNLTATGSTTLTGAVALRHTATAALTLSDATTLTGDINIHDTATATLNLADAATLTGDIALHDTAALTLHLTRGSTLTAATARAPAATLALRLDASTWHMTADSALTRLHLAPATGAQVRYPAPTPAGAYHTLTLADDLTGSGAFAMHADIAARAADRLIIQGAATGAHQVALTAPAASASPTPATGNEPPLLIVQAAAGDATFTGALSAGPYDYNLQTGAQLAAAGSLNLTPADASNWYLARTGLSATADTIVNTTAMLDRDWHYSLDALHLRMGEIHTTHFATATPAPGATSAIPIPAPPSTSTSPLNYVSGGPATGNVWAHARAYRLNAGSALTGRAFEQYAYGLTAGADKAHRAPAATLLAGAFIDMGRIDVNFSGDASTGHTDNLSAGLYGTWLHDTGWHADLVLKADRYKHRFDSLTPDARPVTGSYTSDAQGFSLELGRRLTRTDGWWIEPAAQAAIVWLRGATYRTTPGNQSLDVTVSTARAAQYRAQLRIGRQLRATPLHPYAKFGMVKTDTAGGETRVADDTFAPDYDGWRREFGLGASYLIDDRRQLYFDYEYSKSANYERPWSLHLGYRTLW